MQSMRTKFLYLAIVLTGFLRAQPCLADGEGFFVGTDLAHWDYKQDDSLFFSNKETRTGKLWAAGPRGGYMVLPDSGVGFLAELSVLRVFNQHLSPVREENHYWFWRGEGNALLPVGDLVVFNLGVNLMKHIQNEKSIPYYGIGFQAGVGLHWQKLLATVAYEESGTFFDFLGEKKRLTGLHLQLSYMLF